jgi:transitional endoplasmic reticulum ATPase|eukprot:COSAG06_NODE_6672_length_2831_cov_2.951318_2_plen_413_part_00
MEVEVNGQGQEYNYDDLIIKRLAELAVGYVAADLANLTREAALRAMAVAPAADELSATTGSPVVVTWEHFEAALACTRPSSLQRLQRGGTGAAVSGSDRDDFQSLESLAKTVNAQAVRQLTASILLPLSTAGRAVFESAGLSPSCGALLYGPPGNGKTLLAAAIGRSCTRPTRSGGGSSAASAGRDQMALGDAAAGLSHFNLIEVHAAELISSVSGESEKNVSALFARARSAAPSVLFIDEIDTLAPVRGRDGGQSSSSLNTLERVLSIFLTQLDGVADASVKAAAAAAAAGPVVIIAATRDISAVDPAILRSGRIDTHVYIGPPDAAAREAIIRLRCDQMADTMTGCSTAGGTSPSLTPAQIARLVAGTEGFSRAEIDSLCRESVMRALREDLGATQVREEHFQIMAPASG